MCQVKHVISEISYLVLPYCLLSIPVYQCLVHILSPVTDNCSSWFSGRGRMAVEMFSKMRSRSRGCWCSVRLVPVSKDKIYNFYLTNITSQITFYEILLLLLVILGSVTRSDYQRGKHFYKMHFLLNIIIIMQ